MGEKWGIIAWLAARAKIQKGQVSRIPVQTDFEFCLLERELTQDLAITELLTMLTEFLLE